MFLRKIHKNRNIGLLEGRQEYLRTCKVIIRKIEYGKCKEKVRDCLELQRGQEI